MLPNLKQGLYFKILLYSCFPLKSKCKNVQDCIIGQSLSFAKTRLTLLKSLYLKRRHDTQHSDIRHNNKLSIALSIMALDTAKLSVANKPH